MDKTLKILFVEDVISDAELIWHEIEKSQILFTKQLIDNQNDFVAALKTTCPDIIISDYALPQFDGMTALSIRNELCPMTAFILVTGSINEEVAVECMKSGADDYILKENLARLGPAINNSINKLKLIREKKAAEEELLKSEQRLQKAQSIAHVGNWELDLSSRSIWGSDEALRIYGLVSENHYIPYEIIKKCPLPEYRDMIDEALDRLLKYNEPYDLEFKIKRLTDGSIRSVNSKAELVLEHDSDQVKVIGVLHDITESKKSDEALKQSELRFMQISEHSGEWIWEVDKNGLYTYSSPTVKQILGYEPEEIVNKKYFYDLFMPGEREELKKNALNAYERKESFENFINTNIHKDGREVILSTSGIPMLDIEGNLLGFRGVDMDITERERSHEALLESKKMIEGIINAIPVRVFWKDKNLVYLGCNKVFAQDSGFNDPAEIVGKDDYRMRWSDEADLYRRDDREVIETGKSKLLIEESQSSPDGSSRTLLTSKLPLLNGKGEITGVLGTYFDITEIKRAEEELKQSYAFNESLLKTIPFGMDIVDDSGNILFQSDNFLKLFGGAKINKKCWELYRDDKTQCMDCPLKNGITIGKTETYESHGVLGKRIFEINHTGMMYKGKEAMLEIFQDITERKDNEQELIMAKEKAEESDKLKTAFLHNISHEIRTPMNAIVGFSALLGEPDTGIEERKSYIDVITQSSNHLLSIITDIVDISNIEANLIKIVKSELNINSALKSLCNQFSPRAAEKNIKLDWETILPDTEALVLTDRTKLTQILSNLISNALKFTDKGSVKISYFLKNNFLEFSVADTGIGILPQFHEKIFDRFYQVQNSVSRLYEGTGLGLAISKAYVELMGGKLWLSSEREKGTTFFFTIPYEKVPEKILPVAERKAPEHFMFTEKKVILVAEDIESNFKLIKYFLSGSNAELIHAINGKEAVEKYLSTPGIDLVLMDIKMPVMDGYSAVKLIREKNQLIPIIAQTAYADDKDKAIELGCSGFISKPFDKKSLFRVLSDFI
jgi:PAS domain S-box-containing protein